MLPLLYAVLKLALSTNPDQVETSLIITKLDDFMRYDKEGELMKEHYLQVYNTVEMIARLYA